VFYPAASSQVPASPSVERRPSDAELDALYRSVPFQPRHVATVTAGDFALPGWWGAGEPSGWADAIEAARTVARSTGSQLAVRKADHAPWHPGRCAALVLDQRVIGHAGELHPRVIAALDLPERTCAMELDLDALGVPAPAQAPTLSNFPPVLLDLALVVPADTAVAELTAVVSAGAGELLESIRLFDVYVDERLHAAGSKSVAFSLRFRASDRTLTVDEATAARDAAVSAARALGATLRA
jgi:phenylalanyl-tRNA synthetase beta chain